MLGAASFCTWAGAPPQHPQHDCQLQLSHTTYTRRHGCCIILLPSPAADCEPCCRDECGPEGAQQARHKRQVVQHLCYVDDPLILCVTTAAAAAAGRHCQWPCPLGSGTADQPPRRLTEGRGPVRRCNCATCKRHLLLCHTSCDNGPGPLQLHGLRQHLAGKGQPPAACRQYRTEAVP